MDRRRLSPATIPAPGRADRSIEPARRQVVELDSAAAEVELRMTLLDKLCSERRLRPASFRTQELAEMPTKEVASDIPDEAEEPCLALAVAVASKDRKAVGIDQIERIPAVISRSSRTGEPPPDESPPSEYSRNPACAFAEI